MEWAGRRGSIRPTCHGGTVKGLQLISDPRMLASSSLVAPAVKGDNFCREVGEINAEPILVNERADKRDRKSISCRAERR